MTRLPLPLDEAQDRVLGLVQPLPIERIPVAGALGRWLAEPLLAARTQPSADLSAMDGYAVTEDDLAGPWQVIGESAAGHPFGGRVQKGQAVRIATGALLPAGAAAVIIQEDLQRDGDQISMTGSPPSPPGKHIRRSGMDFTHGSELAAAGTLVTPAIIALALAAGHREIAVRRRPRLVIIDSGDELAADPASCLPHQVPASNGAMLAALAASIPSEIVRIGPVADSLDALTDALSQAREADVIVTSGGASVGDHDLVRPALEAWGARIDFWRIAIKPGKPLLVAQKNGQIVLGLPGNPVSSHVTAYLFLLPLLRALSGAAEPLPCAVLARLSAPLRPTGDRREFLRCRWNGIEASPEVVQDSGALAALARSNALIDRPAGAPAAEAGDTVRVYPVQNGGIA